METAHNSASAYESSLSSNSRQAPLTVNPKYPLPSSLPPQKTISSRRRRVSGKSHATTVESPKLPPLSYRDQYVSGASDSPTMSNSTSFAARIRAAPTDLISAHIPNDDFDPLIKRTAYNRRESLNRPPGALYAALQSSNRASYPSPNIASPAPLVSLNDATSKQAQAPDTKATQNTSNRSAQTSKYQEDSIDTTSRSTSRRVSAGVTDRSPLQDLEVKLNDISKEEKRARVQEAEQLLKASGSGAGNRTSGPDVDVTLNTKQARRSSAVQGGKLRSQLRNEAVVIERKRQDISTNTRPKPEQPAVQNLFRSEIQHSPLRRNPNPQSDFDKVSSPSKLPLPYERAREPLTRAVQAPEPEQDPGRAHIQERSALKKLDRDIQSQGEKSNSQSRILKVVKPGFTLAPEIAPVVAQPDRLSRDELAMGINSSKQASRQQKRSSKDNTDKAKSNDSPPSGQGSVNPAKLHSEDRKGEVPTDLKLPHPSGGTATGKQSGSIHSPIEVSNGTVHSKHHLGNFLHHSLHHDSNFQGGPAAKPSRLDEWKRAETARLTAADVNPGNETVKKQGAWWESGVYHSAKSPARNRRDVQSLDDDYDGLYGKTSLSPSPPKGSMEIPPQSSYSISAAHARRYITNEEVYQGRGESWLRGYARLHGREKHISLSTAYSHSCPHLDEHDGSHPYHICKPYMSRELIRSMRAIRIRVAPPTASFKPPLYLKCGPLLRYTGLDRQVPATEAADSSSNYGMERELWRGSVMIVTVDADSSYNPPPVLRLFPEPIDLLSPPPHPVDEGSGHTSEYIDPIAGLPKLSRTGKTVYVKPVQDLEEQVDLSRVEDDGGLFEETRTAAVPTSYGQPSSRPGGGLSSPSTSTRDGRRERDNTSRYQKAKGVKLHAERGVTFWRFNLEIELTEWQVRIAYRINDGASVGFWIPARGQTMNVMFHSCNGFSMSIKSVQSTTEPCPQV